MMGGYQASYTETLVCLLVFSFLFGASSCIHLTFRYLRLFNMWLEYREIAPTTAEATDVYQELSPEHPVKMNFIFVAQMFLYHYYLRFLWENKPDFSREESIQYYYGGVLVQVALMFNSGGFWVADYRVAKYWAFIGVAA